VITALLLGHLLLAAVFAVAAVAKVVDPPATRRAWVAFGGPATLASFAAAALPLVELGTAFALLMPATAWWAAVFAGGLTSLFTVAVAAQLGKREPPACPCFGSSRPTPVGPFELTRNLLLVGLALGLAVGGKDEAGPDLAGRIGQHLATRAVPSPAADALAAVGLLGTLAGATLLVQRGRRATARHRSAAAEGSAEAMRSSQLARTAEASSPLQPAPGIDAIPGTAGSSRPTVAPPLPGDGLPIGSPTPFWSPAGRAAAHRPTLLLFVSEQSPACPPPGKAPGPPRTVTSDTPAGVSARSTEALPPPPGAGALASPAADGAREQPRPLAPPAAADAWAAAVGDTLDIALVYRDGSRGDGDAELARRFRVRWAPAALLLDARGRVASSVRYGAAAIQELARSARETYRHRAGDPPAVDDGARRAGALDAMPGEGGHRGLVPEPGEPHRSLPQERRADHAELAIGAPAPPLRLPDARGVERDLRPLLSRETALLFWHPDCTHCRAMAPALRRLETQAADAAPQLVFVTAGPLAAARRAQTQFASLSLFDPELASAARFRARGTPSAILIDQHGRIGSALARGRDDVAALLGLSDEAETMTAAAPAGAPPNAGFAPPRARASAP
jgi:thiol-disulfide isomerase/thioredoxin/uncharacterized membrane protein YphA (DoxX/SURF4 family)